MTRDATGSTSRLDELRDRVRSMTASPLLYVGGVTVVLAHEITDWVAASMGLSEFQSVLVLFPVTLVVLYAQLAALALYQRDDGRRGCAPSSTGK